MRVKNRDKMHNKQAAKLNIQIDTMLNSNYDAVPWLTSFPITWNCFWRSRANSRFCVTTSYFAIASYRANDKPIISS